MFLKKDLKLLEKELLRRKEKLEKEKIVPRIELSGKIFRDLLF